MRGFGYYHIFVDLGSDTEGQLLHEINEISKTEPFILCVFWLEEKQKNVAVGCASQTNSLTSHTLAEVVEACKLTFNYPRVFKPKMEFCFLFL